MQNVLVIGGNGFLGAALVEALRKEKLARVRSFDLAPYPDPAVESLVGDLRNKEEIMAACAGIDTVFQTAALVDWGPRNREKLYAVNVEGNRNVIDACLKQGVERLVYTSSIDVVFDGTPIRNGDESLPVPEQHLDDYGDTKALGELDVLKANTARHLQTCALRSAGIYGPGDRHRLPVILKTARQGSMVRLGNGKARFSHVYIDNLVQAHIQAARALKPGSSVSGQAYFITDHEPGNFYDFFTPYMEALHVPVPGRSIPTGLAYLAAVVLEGLAWMGIGPRPPLLTRYIVRSTCEDFYFSHAKATRDFGYAPRVSAKKAFEETLNWLRREGI